MFVGDSLHCAPLERPYKARLLSHFPKSVPWNKFDKDSVCMVSSSRIILNSVDLRGVYRWKC